MSLLLKYGGLFKQRSPITSVYRLLRMVHHPIAAVLIHRNLPKDGSTKYLRAVQRLIKWVIFGVTKPELGHGTLEN